MAYDTYGALKTAVADWLHRSDMVARIPDMIRLAEQTINRRLTIFPKEIELPLVSEIGSRYVALPADFDSPIKLQSRHVEPRYDFTFVEASQLPINDDTRKLPWYWAIDGQNIAFEGPADQQYPLILRYLQTVYLSDALPTNPLFARANDLYLYGALAQSAEFIQNDARVAAWQRRFDSLLTAVAADAARSKGMAPLQTEIPAALSSSSITGQMWPY